MSGHGHVTPNPDGSKARCGGPRMCPECAKEFARLNLYDADGPPYPTQWAYAQVCKARTKWQQRAEKAEAEIERPRAQVARLREALSECAEELACVSDTRSTNTIYAAARAALRETEL